MEWHPAVGERVIAREKSPRTPFPDERPRTPRPLKPMNSVLEEAKQTLSKVLGAERGAETMARARNIAGVGVIASPADLLSFAEALIQDGGFTEVVGRALKVQALLRGADGPSGGDLEP